MGFQDFMKSFFMKRQMSVGYVARSPEPPFLSTDQNQAQVAERFWSKSIYFHNSISKMAKVVAITGFKVMPKPGVKDDIDSGKAKKEKKMLEEFMTKPTKGFSETFISLIYRTVAKLLVHGQCGWEVIQGSFPNMDSPNSQSFHCQLIDGWVTAKHDDYGVLLNDGAFEQYFESHIVKFPKEQIIYFRYPDPFRSWNGRSNIHLLASQIAMEIQSEEYNLNFFKNRAVPSGIFSLPEFLLPEEFLAAKQRLTEAYQGVHNAHASAIVLSGQVQYTPIQSNPNEAQLDEARERIRDDIMVTMGSPPPVLGYSAKDGKVEVSEVDNTFLRYNVPFVQHLIADQINMFCSEVLGYKYYMLIPRNADVVKNAAEINALINEVQYGIITPNEAREKLGEDPHTDGDNLMLPNTPLGPQRVGDIGGDLPEKEQDKEDISIKDKPNNPALKTPVKKTPKPPTEEEVKAALEIWAIMKKIREQNKDE